VGTKACIKINPELTEKTYGKVHTAESRKSTGDSVGGEKVTQNSIELMQNEMKVSQKSVKQISS
jgi:hypothetical protein